MPELTEWDSTIREEAWDSLPTSEEDSVMDSPPDYEEDYATESSTESDVDSVTSQEVAPTFEDYGYNPLTDTVPDGTWDSHWADISEKVSVDSGYASLPELPPWADKYDSLPFVKKHYLHNYVQRILEATFFRYARDHLAAELSNPDWQSRAYLVLDLGNLASRDWLKEDANELVAWVILFARGNLNVPLNGNILGNVQMLRNATAHRGNLVDDEGEKWEFTSRSFAFAIRLPELLKDPKAENEINDVLGYIMEDPGLDKNTRVRIEHEMYAPQCRTRWQLLLRIQTLLEKTCFDNASRKIPNVLTQKLWQIPEQVELKELAEEFWRRQIEHDESANDILPGTRSWYLRDALRVAVRKVRNVANHRSPVTEDGVVLEVHRAIRICILQSDWRQAIEIEVQAEMFFTRSSRREVLKRLESVSTVGEVETAYEAGRRVAIEAFLTAEDRTDDAVADEQDEDEWLALDGPEEFVLGGSSTTWVKGTWSPSMHECLKSKRLGENEGTDYDEEEKKEDQEDQEDEEKDEEKGQE